MRFLVALLLISPALAGCAEMIPDPPVEGNDPEWITEYHNFTLDGNTTLPVITVGNNESLVEIFSASVILYNETVNLTVDKKPYFLMDDMWFQTGHAPVMGNVTLQLIELQGYDYNCTIVYRMWEL